MGTREKFDSTAEHDALQRVDLGGVRRGSFCRLSLAHDVEEDFDKTPLQWDVDPPGSGFSVESEGEDLLITVPTADVGKRLVRIASGVSEFSVSAFVTGGANAWPDPISEEQARKSLSDWGRQHRLVPDWLFDGDLSLRDASVGRGTVLVQSEFMESVTRSAPSLPDLPLSGNGDGGLTLQLDRWEESSGEAIEGQTIVRETCEACDESHLVRCSSCAGRGTITCPTTVRCHQCNGSGTTLSVIGLLKVGAQELQASRTGEQGGGQRALMHALGTPPEEYLEQCPECLGRKQVTCPECGGSGERPCDQCVQGQSRCPVCGGDGIRVRFQVTVRTRTSSKDSLTSGEKLRIIDQYEDRFVPLEPSARDLVGNVPTSHMDLKRWAHDRAMERSDGEIVRRIWIEVLPITAVDYKDGETTKSAFLIGDDRTVYAPGAITPSLGRLQTAFGRLPEPPQWAMPRS